MVKFINTLAILSPIVLSVGLGVSALYHRKLSSFHRLLAAYLVVALSTELLSKYFGFINQNRFNLFLIPLFGLGEFIIFSQIYYRHFFQKSKLILTISIIVLFAILVDIMILGEIFVVKDYSTYTKVFSNLTIIGFCLNYLKKYLEQAQPNKKLLLFNNVFLLYFVVNLLLSASMNFLVNEKMSIIGYFLILNVLVFISFYSFITYQIWQHGKTQPPLRYG